MRIEICLFVLSAVALMAAGAGERVAAPSGNVRVSGTPDKVRFATAWSTLADPAAAATEATRAALAALGTPAKGIVFYVFYEDPSLDTFDKPDLKKEEAAAAAVHAAAGGVPNIGCRARSLVNGGTLQKDAVAVLAIGGNQVSAAAVSAPILDARLQTGRQIAAGVKDVKDLKLVFALAQPQLSFEAKEGVSVEDFIKGVIDNTPKGTVLFGGNSMGGGPADGRQFINGKALEHSVVALGVGGPIELFSNHTNEFTPSEQTFTATRTVEKWIITLDDRPAAQVYREASGMTPDDKLTWDDQHPIGVVVAPDKVYLRMVLNEIGADGKDKDGKVVQVTDEKGQLVTIPPGSLRFIAPIVQGSKVKVLKWEGKPEPILASASSAIQESLKEAKAANTTPALSLLSNCCARGFRLLELGKGERDEITQAILPDMKKVSDEIPVFGFYAYGELGPIRGTYQGYNVQYQQHTFVSTVVGIR